MKKGVLESEGGSDNRNGYGSIGAKSFGIKDEKDTGSNADVVINSEVDV